MKQQKRPPRRRVVPRTAVRNAHAAIVAPGGAPELPQNPNGMSDDELAYRTLLQEAVLFVVKQIMEERRAEITSRAEARVKTLQELRST